MAQLVLNDVPEETAAALEKRARANGRSAEAEHRAILEAALEPKEASDFWARAARLRKELEGRVLSDSTQLLRESRDSR
ncbi:MAG: hypothetical protein WDN03_06880 [Rhizomicrobium sp.]